MTSVGNLSHRAEVFSRPSGGLLIGFSLSDSGILPQLDGCGNGRQPRARGSRCVAARWEPDENIEVFTGKVDIGMGVQTALGQVVAEEMDVAFERVQSDYGRYI
jgi:nicotinate dehydrogenase subunit B